MKTCSKCKVLKQVTQFQKDITHKDGYKSICRTCRKEDCKKYYNNKKTHIIQYNKNYYCDNRERKKLYQKKYFQSNKKCINKKCKIYIKNKLKSDVEFKIKITLRKRLRDAIKNNVKSGSAVKDLGCSIQFLKQYLESKFYPNPQTGEQMSWSNHALKGWHIDHVIALANFDLTDREQLIKACNYTNLQPLWWFENLKKNKY